MIDIIVNDRYSGDSHTYSGKNVQIDIETKTLILDDVKIKLFQLDRLTFTESE